MNDTVLTDFFEHLLSGNTFSDLDDAKQLYPIDLLLVTRKSNNQLSSYSVSYSTLSSAVLDDWNKHLSVGSMAYEESWKYALSSHDHDGIYNNLVVSQRDLHAHDKQCIALLSTSSEDGILSIYAPVIVSEDPPEYEIGTLRFVCSNNMHAKFTDADLSVEDFDGWVYADGTVFTPLEADRVRFQKALDAYGTEPNNATSFKVPDICNFIKAASSPMQELSISQQQLGIAEHKHDIGKIVFDGDLKLKPDFTLKTYEGGSSSDAQYRSNIHNGVDKNKKVGSTKFNLDLQQVGFDLSCDYYGTRNQAFEPRHRSIPVMVYIGGVKY